MPFALNSVPGEAGLPLGIPQPGFLDLIQLLLASPNSTVEPGATLPENSAQAGAEPQEIASDARLADTPLQTADALVRLILGNRATVANAFSDKAIAATPISSTSIPKKGVAKKVFAAIVPEGSTLPAKHDDRKQPSIAPVLNAAATPILVPVLAFPFPLPRLGAASAGLSDQNPKLTTRVRTEIRPVRPASGADLAFALRLIPEPTAGQIQSGNVPGDQVPSAITQSGQAPAEQISSVQAQSGQTPDEQISDGQIPRGQIPGSQIQSGNLPEKTAPQPELANVSRPNSNTDTPDDTEPTAATKATAGHASHFAQVLENLVSGPPSPAQPGAKAVEEAPMKSAGEALRSSEPMLPAAPQLPQASTQQIAVRIARPEAPVVDLHVVERGGQVHVAVRTPDPGLQSSLRQDLGTLVNSLERSGYRTEAIAPHDGTQTAAPSQTNPQNSRHDSKSDSGGNGYAQPDSSGGGRQQQGSRERRVPKWIEELENTK